MHDHRSNRESGLTLVELMVVVTVIAILASMAVPGFLQSRNAADRSAVIGTMRAIVNAQSQFKTMSAVDANGDGGPEFGTLIEMTGKLPLRGGDGSTFVKPKLLSTSLGDIDANGRVSKHGHYFALFLPGAGGSGLAEAPANLANIDAVLAGSYWTLVAWPVVRGQTGNATYFVNQQGEILRSTDAPYTGTSNVPLPGVALINTGNASRIDSNEIAVGQVGIDGNNWKVVQ